MVRIDGCTSARRAGAVDLCDSLHGLVARSPDHKLVRSGAPGDVARRAGSLIAGKSAAVTRRVDESAADARSSRTRRDCDGYGNGERAWGLEAIAPASNQQYGSDRNACPAAPAPKHQNIHGSEFVPASPRPNDVRWRAASWETSALRDVARFVRAAGATLANESTQRAERPVPPRIAIAHHASALRRVSSPEDRQPDIMPARRPRLVRWSSSLSRSLRRRRPTPLFEPDRGSRCGCEPASTASQRRRRYRWLRRRSSHGEVVP